MCTPNTIVADIFSPFQEYINSEQDVREVIHQEQNIEKMHGACLKARQIFEDVRAGYIALDLVIPPGQYYRYNDHWRFATQRLCFLAALIVFLEKGILVNKETTAKILGVDDKANIHLDLEDYLMGLLNLASELSRYAVNSVTYGDYERPLQISKFVAELNAGFRLLNLKNDSLRKRFDALKYDVKKIEEVVYDLSIRGLAQSPGTCEITK
ncbi:hypothetical protein NQ314_007455 [Rhamnusium bicolor]|uniref:Translin n=1 Tax=Rhamnusium bicolor TaxID=1586634 RepID=A0AAV8YPZ6_9CUCU|nr:hypothetical protein NQ314_007455 [Rhamnusium bicolor]